LLTLGEARRTTLSRRSRSTWRRLIWWLVRPLILLLTLEPSALTFDTITLVLQSLALALIVVIIVAISSAVSVRRSTVIRTGADSAAVSATGIIRIVEIGTPDHESSAESHTDQTRDEIDEAVRIHILNYKVSGTPSAITMRRSESWDKKPLISIA
jgi:hypothetical protein